MWFFIALKVVVTIPNDKCRATMKRLPTEKDNWIDDRSEATKGHLGKLWLKRKFFKNQFNLLQDICKHVVEPKEIIDQYARKIIAKCKLRGISIVINKLKHLQYLYSVQLTIVNLKQNINANVNKHKGPEKTQPASRKFFQTFSCRKTLQMSIVLQNQTNNTATRM